MSRLWLTRWHTHTHGKVEQYSVWAELAISIIMPDFDIPDNDHNFFLSSALWSCLRIVQVQKNHHSGPTTAELTKKYFSQVFSFTKNTLIFAGFDNNADVLQNYIYFLFHSWNGGLWRDSTNNTEWILKCLDTRPNFTLTWLKLNNA